MEELLDVVTDIDKSSDSSGSDSDSESSPRKYSPLALVDKIRGLETQAKYPVCVDGTHQNDIFRGKYRRWIDKIRGPKAKAKPKAKYPICVDGTHQNDLMKSFLGKWFSCIIGKLLS